jgi:hypothetical protein
VNDFTLILVWSTIPLDTDLGKIGNPKEVPHGARWRFAARAIGGRP